MISQLIDRYQDQDSFLHRLDPKVKIIFSLIFIFSNLIIRENAYLSFGFCFIFLLLLNKLSNLGVFFSLKRSFIVLPFLLAAIAIPFTVPGHELFELSIANTDLTITDVGLSKFFAIMIRSWLSVQVVILLTATSKFIDLAHSLRHLGIPKIIISIFSFMFRYLFVLIEEANRLMRARNARSGMLFNQRRPGIGFQAKTAGNLVGQLFLRSLERSQRVYLAMQARGFQGQFLTLQDHDLNSIDIVSLIIGSCSLLIVLLLQFIV